MTQTKSNRKKLSLDNRKDKTKAELCETKAELRQKHIKVEGENGMFDTIGNFFRCGTNHSKVNARWDDDDNRSKVLQQTTLKEYEFPFL